MRRCQGLSVLRVEVPGNLARGEDEAASEDHLRPLTKAGRQGRSLANRLQTINGSLVRRSM